MKILHTSDWHLGKTIHGQDLLEDQRKVLLDLQGELSEGYDALLIAGDIYDRSIPPSKAVDLFSKFIENMAEMGVTTVVIPGNHDSPERLDFASGILERNNIHFRCHYDRITEPITIRDREGNLINVFALPFVDEVKVRALFPQENLKTHQDATAFLVKMIRDGKDPDTPSILMAHTYTGREVRTSESERELLVGNQGYVDIEAFDGFDHVLLGHLHRSQAANKSLEVYYSGSLIPYSFSEVDHPKSSSILEYNGKGWKKRRFDHRLEREFRVIEDSFRELLESERYSGFGDDYLSVKLTDKGFLVDIHKRLMERFPHILEVDQPALHRQPEGPDAVSREDSDDPVRLFSLFLDRFGWEEEKERAVEIFEEVCIGLSRKEVNS
jgi:exonuclease SbcD